MTISSARHCAKLPDEGQRARLALSKKTWNRQKSSAETALSRITDAKKPPCAMGSPQTSVQPLRAVKSHHKAKEKQRKPHQSPIKCPHLPLPILPLPPSTVRTRVGAVAHCGPVFRNGRAVPVCPPVFLTSCRQLVMSVYALRAC